MIVVAYQRTQAGAAQRLAERARTLPAPLDAPEVQSKPVEAPVPVLAMRVVKLMTPRDHHYRVMDLVARMHGSTFKAIMSRTRQSKHVGARHAAICAVREEFPEISKPHLGRIFGGLDHSTLYNAFRKRGYVERQR